MKLLRHLALCLLTLSSLSALAADPPFTLEEYFKPPQISGPTLSLDTKVMAITMPYKGRMNLALLDLATRDISVLTAYEDFDVIGVTWIGNDKLLYSLGQANSPTGPGQFDGGGLFVIGRDGKNLRRLAKTIRETRADNQNFYTRLSFFRRIPGNDDEVIAEGNLTSNDSNDLYRLNLKTGKTVLLTAGRPSDLAQDWILDSKLVPRIMTAGIRDKLTTVVYYRKDENSPWYELIRYEANKPGAMVPLGFESDDQTLQVAYNGGRDTMAIFRYDPNNKKMGEMIAGHPRYDMGATANGQGVAGVINDPLTDKILGYRVDAAKPEVTWADEKYAAIQAALDRTFPDRINRFFRIRDSKRLIVTSYSDTLPTRWYVYDDEARTVQQIAASRPWMDGKLVPQIPFTFKTRDGLEIPGYYFLPKDYKPGTKLPTIVHIHGGPFARADYWGSGFGVLEGRLFASRGYAVIVPNFRITPGLGSKIFYAGFDTYGREMSDDHEDALKWGIEQGFVDPKRVCISGASYGGYAALQALIRSQTMWKCAISGLAPTDMKFQLTTFQGDTAANTAGVNFWKSVIGTDDLNSQKVRDLSPIYQADKIKQPVFMYAGADDIRVPLPQMLDMAAAMEKAGNPLKGFVIKKKEGHGYGTIENNVDLYTKILAFLKEQFGE